MTPAGTVPSSHDAEISGSQSKCMVVIDNGQTTATNMYAVLSSKNPLNSGRDPGSEGVLPSIDQRKTSLPPESPARKPADPQPPQPKTPD